MSSKENCENTNDSSGIENAPSNHAQTEEVADFEKAIQTAGFGWFNLCAILMATLTIFATSFDELTMSFIVPVAECDLMLTLQDKGILNGVVFGGKIISALLWGYIADTQGRIKLLIIGLLCNAVIVMASSLSQNAEMLIIFKFFGGFIINGPGAISFTYIIEVHGAKYRPHVFMIMGMALCLARLIMPILAWAIFPRDWNFVLFNSLNVYSWQIFLFVSASPSIISGFGLMFFPESPKFLMSKGRNKEALKAFQKIYAINNRKPKQDYPIKQLVQEVAKREQNSGEAIYTIDTYKPDVTKIKTKSKSTQGSMLISLQDDIKQIKPLFRKPLLGYALLVYALHFCTFLGMKTIRLWLPQIFASISEYESLNINDDSGNLCKILEYTVNQTSTISNDFKEKCAVRPLISTDVYINNIIVSTAGVLAYGLSGKIDQMIGGKRIMIYGFLISGFLGLSLYWSINSLSTLIISALYLSITAVSTMSILSIAMSIFPTSLRAIIVASALMMGRLGALSGNLLFPVLIEWNCIPPFLMVGSMLLISSGLSCILPSGKKIAFT